MILLIVINLLTLLYCAGKIKELEDRLSEIEECFEDEDNG